MMRAWNDQQRREIEECNDLEALRSDLTRTGADARRLEGDGLYFGLTAEQEDEYTGLLSRMAYILTRIYLIYI